jgi:hypothetical protein
MPGPSKLNEGANIPRGAPNMTRLIFHADAITGIGQAATIGELLSLLSGQAPVTTFSNQADMLANTSLGVGYMAYIVETNSIYLYQGPDPESIDSYILLASGGGSGGGSGSVLTGQYKFDTTTTEADPGAGFLRLNSASFSAANEIYIDALTQQAVNIGFILGSMATRDEIRIQLQTDDDNNAVYELLEPPTDMDGWWKFSVINKTENGALFADDADIIATVILGGTPYDQMNIDGGRADSIYNTIPGIDGGAP